MPDRYADAGKSSIGGHYVSNIKEKDNYKSVDKASFTFDELEEWLLNLIVNIYHKRIHRGIEMRPEDKWDLGIFGNGREHIGCGLPDIPVDKERLMLDFMPFTYRTIQANGVTWDGVRYFDFCLAPFIGKSENGKSCEYLFRRDPRNVAVIYFFNRIQKVMSVFLQRIKSFPEQAYGNCGKQKNVCVNWEEKITTGIN